MGFVLGFILGIVVATALIVIYSAIRNTGPEEVEWKEFPTDFNNVSFSDINSLSEEDREGINKHFK